MIKSAFVCRSSREIASKANKLQVHNRRSYYTAFSADMRPASNLFQPVGRWSIRRTRLMSVTGGTDRLLSSNAASSSGPESSYTDSQKRIMAQCADLHTSIMPLNEKVSTSLLLIL